MLSLFSSPAAQTALRWSKRSCVGLVGVNALLVAHARWGADTPQQERLAVAETRTLALRASWAEPWLRFVHSFTYPWGAILKEWSSQPLHTTFLDLLLPWNWVSLAYRILIWPLASVLYLDWLMPVTPPGGREVSTPHIGLPRDERSAIEAYCALMRFHLKDNRLQRYFTSNVVFNDTLMCFDGASELRDGWAFLSRLFDYADPEPILIQRDVDTTGCAVLHIKMETEARLAKWLGHLGPHTFSSHATLTMESSPALRGAPRRVEAIEHRWFNGPVMSRMTGSHDSMAGDMGDLWRRVNGFLLSLILTAPVQSGMI